MPNVIREPKGALRARQREIVKTLSRHGLAFLVDRAHAGDTSASRPEHVRLAPSAQPALQQWIEQASRTPGWP